MDTPDTKDALEQTLIDLWAPLPAWDHAYHLYALGDDARLVDYLGTLSAWC